MMNENYLDLDNLLFLMRNNRQIGKSSTKNAFIEVYNKILMDGLYSPLFLKHGFDYIKKAGFFLDETTLPLDLKESIKLMCTPLQHISNKTNDNSSIVIVSSGSFCPIHDGHIEMLQLTKETLEQKGFNVLGGFIAPDHDSYVSRKNKDEHISINERLLLISEKIWEHNLQDWLAVDPWYGLFNECDINFSDLLIRTKIHIKHYLNIDTNICYVTGADNGDFSLAFENAIGMYCSVVNRPTYPPYHSNLSNVFVIDNNNPESSTNVRKTYKQINRKKSTSKLRLDNTQQIPLEIFKPYFDEIVLVDYKEQQDKFDLYTKDKNVISLDPLIRGDNYIQTSRVYDIFGHNKSGRLIDIDFDKLDKNINYDLYDDDIYTGNTMRDVAKVLQDNSININSYFTFNSTDYKDCEILDNRDFIIFSTNDISNGLVINDDGLRVPYVYPFVDPYLRCSITNPMQFSLDIWLFNLQLNKDNCISLKDTFQKELFVKIGFSENTLIKDICMFYIKQLQKIIMVSL